MVLRERGSRLRTTGLSVGASQGVIGRRGRGRRRYHASTVRRRGRRRRAPSSHARRCRRSRGAMAPRRSSSTGWRNRGSRVNGARCTSTEASAAALARSAAPNAVGVVKSHRILYGDPAAVRTILSLVEGERSSVFTIDSPDRRRSPVASWYLRIRDAAGRDPLWGMVRVESLAAERGRGARQSAHARTRSRDGSSPRSRRYHYRTAAGTRWFTAFATVSSF